MLKTVRVSSSSTHHRGDRIAWILVTVLCGALFFGLARQSSQGPLTSHTPQNYYAYMTDAVLSGQLALKIEPKPELLALPDPYDARLNGPYKALDLTLYKGRYYFYWGLSPVILLLAPWCLVTKTYLAESAATALLAAGCAAVLAGLLLEIRRRDFPKVGWAVTILAVAAVVSGSFLAFLPMSNSVYEVPIACAALCQAIAWYGLYRALTTSVPVRWTLLAGAALAFAIGARANYIMWLPCFVVPLVALWKAHPGRRVALTLAASLPLAAGLSAMFAINWLRFGAFTEFGMYYQLTASGRSYPSFKWASLLSNWQTYGWSHPRWSRFFPFVAAPTAGLFNLLPAVYGVVGLRFTRNAPGVAALGWTCALAGIGGMVTMAFLPWAATRYMVDFLPAALLAGSLGGFALWDRAEPTTHRVLQWLFVAACTATIAVSACLQAGDWAAPYARIRPLGRVLNEPVFALDQVLGVKHGVAVVTFRLPTNRTGSFEPLVSTGTPAQGEIVFLEYTDPSHVQIGFFQTATTHWISAPLPIDYAAKHAMRLTLGSLGPPDSDPLFERWPAEERERRQQVAEVTLDGQLIYKASLDFGMRRGESAKTAVNGVEPGVCADHFSGSILDSRVEGYPRTPPAAPEESKRFGACVVDLVFPTAVAPGRRDPLVTSGGPGAGDIVYVIYPSAGKVAFGHDQWNYGGSTSPVLALDVSRPHHIVVSYDGLYRPKPVGDSSDKAAGGRHRFRITVDGQLAMDVDDGSYLAAPDTVTIGENRIGGSSASAQFSGKILSMRRDDE